MTKQLPDAIQNATAKIDEYARGMISGTGSTLFEELGFYYIGPVDGHNLQDLVDVLTGPAHSCWQTACAGLPTWVCTFAEIRSTETVGPVLLHVVTEKGRGYLPAETASDKMHGVTQYDTITGKQVKSSGKVANICGLVSMLHSSSLWLCMQAQSLTNFFADALIAEAKRDSRIVGIHAAMGGGTGMNRFEQVGSVAHAPQVQATPLTCSWVPAGFSGAGI